jgi:hypothetical protein
MHLHGNAQARAGADHPVHAERDVPSVVTHLGHHYVANWGHVQREFLPHRTDVRACGEGTFAPLGGENAAAPAAFLTQVGGLTADVPVSKG